MTKKDYYRIRNEVYKSAGKDTFDFDLMMVRIISKAIEEERDACAKLADDWQFGDDNLICEISCAAAIRARGQG